MVARRFPARPGYLFLVIFIAALWLMLMPWTPRMPARGLDNSWYGILDHAFESRLQFGSQLLINYGPLGFVQLDRYSPGSYLWVLALRGSILFLLGNFYFKVLRPLPFAYAVAGALTLVAALHASAEAIYGSVPVVEALILSQDDIGLVDTVELALLCGTVSLIKFTYFILIAIVFLIMALYRVLRWREFPIAPILSAFAMIGLYLVAGQHLSSIWEYLRGSISIAAGYSEAMQVEGPLLAEIYFCLLAASLLLVVGVHEFHRLQRWAWFPITALTLIVFMIFKEGFVRHGGGHSAPAFAWLAVVVALYAAEMSRRRFNTPGAALLVLAAVPFLVGFARVGTPLRDAIGNLRSVSELVRHGVGPLNIDYETAQAAIRRAVPLPEVQGSVDIYPYEQSALFANRLKLGSQRLDEGIRQRAHPSVTPRIPDPMTLVISTRTSLRL